MDSKEKLEQNIARQNELIAIVEGSMDKVPDQQKSTQAVALKFMKDELAQLTALQLSL